MAVMDGPGSVRLAAAWGGKLGHGSHGEACQAEAWTGCVRSGRNENIESGEEA